MRLCMARLVEYWWGNLWLNYGSDFGYLGVMGGEFGLDFWIDLGVR